MLMPFGKHKDDDLEDIPTAYLRWAAGELKEKNDARKELIAEIEKELAFRERFGSRNVV